MVKVIFKCENCPKEIKLEAQNLVKVKDILKELGWFNFSNLTLCPDCRNKPTK